MKPISHGRKRRVQGSSTIWVEKMPETIDDDGCGLPTLIKYVSEERKPGFFDYVRELIESASYEFDASFVGFISDYSAYAQILNRKVEIHDIRLPWSDPHVKRPPMTIYDVGCGGALQHLVFDPRIHYVGIDVLRHPEPKFFRDNCRFVSGRFSEIVDSLGIDRQSAIGIANMSLLYYETSDPAALELFNRTFLRKFVL